MINLFPLQILSSANQANLEAMHAISLSMLTAAERVAALNFDMSRTAIENAAKGNSQIKGDGWESLMSRQGDALKPVSDTATAYFRSAQEITATAQSEITKAITTRAGEAASSVVAFMENLEKSVPAVAGMSSAISELNPVTRAKRAA